MIAKKISVSMFCVCFYLLTLVVQSGRSSRIWKTSGGAGCGQLVKALTRGYSNRMRTAACAVAYICVREKHPWSGRAWYVHARYICNSYYPRNGATWVMLPEGWMLSRGRSPSDNISPRATNPCCTISWVVTDLLYLPFWQTREAFQQDLYRNDCIYP